MMSLLIVTALSGLSCPPGTHEVRRLSRVACEDAAHVLHGPYVSLYASGAVEAVGQTEHGFRSGKWVFYDEKGTLVGETEFRRGNYDGRRVTFRPDGSVLSEERWSNGELIAGSASPVRRKR